MPSPLNESPFLNDEHRRQLQHLIQSRKVTINRGYYSATTPEQFASLGLAAELSGTTGLVVPSFNLRRERVGERVRLDDNGSDEDGGRAIWVQRPDYTPVINIAPEVRWLIYYMSPFFVITGNAIAADHAMSCGVPAASCDWDLEWPEGDLFFRLVPVKGRQIVLVIGRTSTEDPAACESLWRMSYYLRKQGAIVSEYCLPIDGALKDLFRVEYVVEGAALKDIHIRAESPRKPKGKLGESGQRPYHYQETPGGILREDPKNKNSSALVTNFSARITNLIEIDDGSEISKEFEIDALVDGQKMTTTVPAREYERMEWVADLGPNAIVFAGSMPREHARVAIQEFSADHGTKRVIAHAGWVLNEHRWWFAHAGGLIGAATPACDRSHEERQVAVNEASKEGSVGERPMRPMPGMVGPPQGLSVRLPAGLERFRLESPTGESLYDDIMTMHSLLYRAFPARLVSPLLAAVFRIAIDGVDFGVHIHGATNLGKSVLAAIFSQFFGAGLDQRHLPGSWNSTANYQLAITSAAKNLLFVVDDFVPKGSRGDVNKAHQIADTLFRALGNQASRGRCNRDGTTRPGRSPQCLVLSTGEAIPDGHSLASRMLMLEIREGDVISNDAEKMKLLTEVQKLAEEGFFVRIMSAFIAWIAMKREVVLCELAEQVEQFRTDVFPGEGRLARTVAIGAELLAGYEAFLDFWHHRHNLSSNDLESFFYRMNDHLHGVVADQAEVTVDANPAVSFMVLLREVMASGRGHALPRCETNTPGAFELYGLRLEEYFVERRGDVEAKSVDDVEANDDDGNAAKLEKRSRLIGKGKQVAYWDAGVTYVIPAPALEAVQEIAERSSLQPLPLTAKSLGVALHSLRVLRQKKSDGHYAEKIRFSGKELRVLAIPDEMIFRDWKKSIETETDMAPTGEAELQRLLESMDA